MSAHLYVKDETGYVPLGGWARTALTLYRPVLVRVAVFMAALLLALVATQLIEGGGIAQPPTARSLGPTTCATKSC